MANVRYFAAAAEAAATTAETVSAASLGELLDALRAERDAHFAAVLGRCAVLVDGVRTDDRAAALRADAAVDVLPPFAGG